MAGGVYQLYQYVIVYCIFEKEIFYCGLQMWFLNDCVSVIYYFVMMKKVYSLDIVVHIFIIEKVSTTFVALVYY